ncbi:LAME_0G15126g1_1 [Lachancea meyersii CBS 8951]|uniref:LAME_0G15126g1_1 n=1 Tax=Lachancea meyersii CBS 8951 TaxID=1266667 RepID=A0A1G4KAN6_9SACH|nr:LAME_0G15126g1_1 [Lachancea meyersii CBS 8951]
MSQDAYYITPNEAALAVVATSMKKARLPLETLICNSIMGGVFFSTGGLLFTACHSLNPGIFEQNPGILDFSGGFMFPIGLFYVVINGADLFNSNILFFVVGLLQGVVSFYDLLISWVVSWIGNLGGTLFVVYVICSLSTVTKSAAFIKYTHHLVAEKDSFNFIRTFIKAIAGNFYVCLAIYLQMMAKPLHVKFLMLVLPIFSFVAVGFTHVVADMFLLTIGMFNGADLPVSRFIWKHMVAATLGNIVGGGAFAAIVPFYMHLVAVENDRKRLALPELEARDEQPELNVDSRVVRIPTKVAEQVEEDAEEGGDDADGESVSEEKNGFEFLSKASSVEEKKTGNNEPVEYRPTASTPRISRVGSALRRVSTNKSTSSVRSGHSFAQRTPVGVFPIKGMAFPQTPDTRRERLNEHDSGSLPPHRSRSFDQGSSFLHKVRTALSERNASIDRSRPPGLEHTFTSRSLGQLRREQSPAFSENILETKMGARLERALTKIGSRISREDKDDSRPLPTTIQEMYPIVRRPSNDPIDNHASLDGHNPLTSHRDAGDQSPFVYRSRNTSSWSGISIPRRPSSAYLPEVSEPRRAVSSRSSLRHGEHPGSNDIKNYKKADS